MSNIGFKEKCNTENCVNAAEYVWFPSDKPNSMRSVCPECWKQLYAREVVEEYKKKRAVKNK
jgi:hypothetical protein